MCRYLLAITQSNDCKSKYLCGKNSTQASEKRSPQKSDNAAPRNLKNAAPGNLKNAAPGNLKNAAPARPALYIHIIIQM